MQVNGVANCLNNSLKILQVTGAAYCLNSSLKSVQVTGVAYCLNSSLKTLQVTEAGYCLNFSLKPCNLLEPQCSLKQCKSLELHIAQIPGFSLKEVKACRLLALHNA